MSEEEKNDFAEVDNHPDKSSQYDIKDLYEKVQKDLNNTIKCIDQIKISHCGNPAWTTLQKHAAEWQRQAEWASRYSHIYSSLPKYAEIQAQIGNIISNLPTIPHIQGIPQSTINAITQTYDAIGDASLSGTLAEYKQNIETAIEAAEDFSNSDSEEDISAQENPLIEQLKELHTEAENAEEKDLPTLQNSAAEVKATFDESISEKVSNIESTLTVFLTKFNENAGKLLNASQLTQQNIEKLVDEAQKNNDKIAEQVRIAEKNGNTVNELLTASQNNFKASKVDAKKNTNLSYVAIGIAFVGVIVQIGLAFFDYCTDKHGKVIEILQKKSPGRPQIHIEKSSDVKVALDKATIVLQDDVKLMQKIDRLQADLKKAQNDLAELQKKYNADKVTWTQEKQKLYAEIAALKKQIEDLKAELIKRPVPQSVSRQEAKNE